MLTKERKKDHILIGSNRRIARRIPDLAGVITHIYTHSIDTSKARSFALSALQLCCAQFNTTGSYSSSLSFLLGQQQNPEVTTTERLRKKD